MIDCEERAQDWLTIIHVFLARRYRSHNVCTEVLHDARKERLNPVRSVGLVRRRGKPKAIIIGFSKRVR